MPDDLDLTSDQQAMLDLCQQHLTAEFTEHSADAALTTMSEKPHLNHVPVMTGGVGREEIRAFYAHRFIPQMAPDAEIELISRTIGHSSIVDEFIFKCTHSQVMDFFLPGIAPTGKRIEVPHEPSIQFRDGKIASEYILLGPSLVQIGLIDGARLPVAGAETVEKIRDPNRPSNGLIERFRNHFLI